MGFAIGAGRGTICQQIGCSVPCSDLRGDKSDKDLNVTLHELQFIFEQVLILAAVR